LVETKRPTEPIELLDDYDVAGTEQFEYAISSNQVRCKGSNT